MKVKCGSGHPDFEVNISREEIDSLPFTPKFQCPECAKEIKEVESERALAEKRESMYNNSCIPLRFQDCTLGTFEATTPEQKNIIKVLMNFMDNLPDNLEDGRNVVLAGPPGTGKTHLACAMLNGAIWAGHPGLYSSVLDAARTVKSTYNRNHDGPFQSEQQAYGYFVYPDLLVLDEVGVQYQTEAEAIIIWEIRI